MEPNLWAGWALHLTVAHILLGSKGWYWYVYAAYFTNLYAHYFVF
jgi:hypothetical protein